MAKSCPAAPVNGSHEVLLWIALPTHYIWHMPAKREKLIDDPEHWRRRAQEARAAADRERNPKIKSKLQGVAKNYEGIAERAEQRGKGVIKPSCVDK